jgi:hypothetical protein
VTEPLDAVARPVLEDVFLGGIAGLTVVKCCRACGALVYPGDPPEGELSAETRHQTWHGAWALLLLDAQARGVAGI